MKYYISILLVLFLCSCTSLSIPDVTDSCEKKPFPNLACLLYVPPRERSHEGSHGFPMSHKCRHCITKPSCQHIPAPTRTSQYRTPRYPLHDTDTLWNTSQAVLLIREISLSFALINGLPNWRWLMSSPALELYLYCGSVELFCIQTSLRLLGT